MIVSSILSANTFLISFSFILRVLKAPCYWGYYAIIILFFVGLGLFILNFKAMVYIMKIGIYANKEEYNGKVMIFKLPKLF